MPDRKARNPERQVGCWHGFRARECYSTYPPGTEAASSHQRQIRHISCTPTGAVRTFCETRDLVDIVADGGVSESEMQGPAVFHDSQLLNKMEPCLLFFC